MLRRWTCVLLVVVLGQAAAFGFEAVAVIKRIDIKERTAVVTSNGREHTARIAADVKLLDADGKDLKGGLESESLKPGATVTLSVEPVDNRPTIQSIRLGGRPSRPGNSPQAPAISGRESVGIKPLTEMAADDHYKEQDGGLYGEGRNEPPSAIAAAAKGTSARIEPLDSSGSPSVEGTIGLVSISMSNATQEFSRFKQIADRSRTKSPRVTIVDCAQGGQTMARWADPQANCWQEADRRLQGARVSAKQVQVAWVKLANAGPNGDLKQHTQILERDTRRVVTLLKERFPNLRIAYLGSRIYAGYATTRLNPEPYAYEGAFAVRGLIQAQAKGDADLNSDPARGAVKAPLLLWGPYFWGDGTTPRQGDGLVWLRSDFADDGTHPSDAGRQKVAEQLLKFFETDAYARTWFVGKQGE